MRNKTVFLGLASVWVLLGALPQWTWAASDLMSSQLADDARQWQQKDRDDLAANLWRKLLRTDPRHPEALVKLGTIELRSGNIQEAEALLRRASALPVPAPGLGELSVAVQAAKGSGKVVVPTPRENQSREDKPTPSGDIQITVRDKPKAANAPQEVDLETLGMYSTPRAVKQKWGSTRRDLEKLVKLHPEDKRYALALARHLTYREGTRRAGIRQIADLAEHGLSNQEAQKAWRRALMSLRATPEDSGLFSSYLQRFPNEPAVRERHNMLASLFARANQETKRSALSTAPELKSPETNSLLKAKENQAKVAAILASAQAEAQRAMDADTSARVRAMLEEAMLLDPANSEVRLALARVYQHLGNLDGASSLLDNVLDSRPDQPDVLHARAVLYAAQKNWSQGLGMLERIPVAARTAEQAKDQLRMWVNVQVQRAGQFFGSSNERQAASLMEQAQAAAGQDTSLMAAVAAGWSDMGQSAKALALMRKVASAGAMTDVATRIKYAEILLHAQQDIELSAQLRDLATHARLSAEQQEDVNRIILGLTLRLTETLRESGRLAEAAEMIDPALQRFDDVRLLLTMARIYKSAGNHEAALELVERVIVREPDDVGYRLLACELALANNDLDKASGHSRAALQLAPSHPRVLSAAGRVEKARGNTAKALVFFQRAQAMESNKEAFANVPSHLALRLLGSVPSVSDALRAPGRPSRVERSGLLPIPEMDLQNDKNPLAPPPDRPTTVPNAAIKSVAPIPQPSRSGALL